MMVGTIFIVRFDHYLLVVHNVMDCNLGCGKVNEFVPLSIIKCGCVYIFSMKMFSFAILLNQSSPQLDPILSVILLCQSVPVCVICKFASVLAMRSMLYSKANHFIYLHKMNPSTYIISITIWLT